MKICISYADWRFRPAQRAHERTALRIGNFDKYSAYSPRDLDANFRQKNQHLLKMSWGTTRWGSGNYLWKPYIVRAALLTLKPEDILVYCDAAMLFLRPIDPAIEVMRQAKLDIIHFYRANLTKESNQTKRDAFILMNCDSPRYVDTLAKTAMCFFLRRTSFTEQFVEEWLHYSQDARILTDMPNQCGKPNYPDMSKHLREQSIFSVLTKKYDIPAYGFRPTIRALFKGFTFAEVEMNKDRPKALEQDTRPLLFAPRGRMKVPSVRFLRNYGAAPDGLLSLCGHHVLWFSTNLLLGWAPRLIPNPWRKLLRFIRRCVGAKNARLLKRFLALSKKALRKCIGKKMAGRMRNFYVGCRIAYRELCR